MDKVALLRHAYRTSASRMFLRVWNVSTDKTEVREYMLCSFGCLQAIFGERDIRVADFQLRTTKSSSVRQIWKKREITKFNKGSENNWCLVIVFPPHWRSRIFLFGKKWLALHQRQLQSLLVSPVHLRKKEKEKEKKTLCSGKIANETTFSIFFIPLRGWKSIL